MRKGGNLMQKKLPIGIIKRSESRKLWRCQRYDEVYYGITNIGTKPTVNDTSEKTVETNIFDFDKDVYGEKMVVELLHYHRKESRFSSVEALQTQLFKDIEFGKQFVAKIR